MLIRAAKLALRSTAYLNKGSLPHVVQMPFFKASALEMNYPGLDHVVTELLLHHRGSEVVVYAFDHEQSLTESPTAGALMFLHAKFTGSCWALPIIFVKQRRRTY